MFIIALMETVEKVIEFYGGIEATQARFGFSSAMAVRNWRKRGLPRDKLVDIHLDTGIDLLELQNAKPKIAA